MLFYRAVTKRERFAWAWLVVDAVIIIGTIILAPYIPTPW